MQRPSPSRQDRSGADQLLGRLYDTVLDPSAWNDVLDRVSSGVGAWAWHLFSMDALSDRVTWSLGGSTQDIAKACDDYNSYYRHIDPRLAWSRHMAPGDWFTCANLLTERDVANSEIFIDHLLPHGIRYSMGGLLRDGSTPCYLGFFREPGRAPFGPEELARVAALTPHLSRAIVLQQHVRDLGLRSFYGAAALDALAFGAAIVESDGRLHYANAAAEDLLRKQDRLTLAHGRLLPVSVKEQEPFAALLDQACRGIAGHRLLAPSSPHPLRLIAVPLRDPRRAGVVRAWPPLALLAFAALEVNEAFAVDLLRSLFHLGSAEARVALALLAGKNVKQIATAHGTALNTVRTQLRSIMEKTGTRRQSELVGLLHELLMVHRP